MIRKHKVDVKANFTGHLFYFGEYRNEFGFHAKKVALAFITSGLDYCNSLLLLGCAATPQNLLHHLLSTGPPVKPTIVFKMLLLTHKPLKDEGITVYYCKYLMVPSYANKILILLQ